MPNVEYVAKNTFPYNGKEYKKGDVVELVDERHVLPLKAANRIDERLKEEKKDAPRSKTVKAENKAMTPNHPNKEQRVTPKGEEDTESQV